MKATPTRQAAIALALIPSAIGLAWVTAEAATARTGGEQITLTGTSTGMSNSPIRVVATGPITGIGTATIHLARNHSEPTTLRFSNGTVHAIAVQKTQRIHFNPKRCRATNDSRGTFRITSGTDAFRGARGDLTYHTHAVLIGARSPSGMCLGKSAPPSSTSIKSMVTGTATIP